jgi:Tol biopolymer transport system component
MAMVLLIVVSIGCSGDDQSGSNGGGTTPSVNRAAYIPPECYAKTTDGAGKTYNNCYVCHSRGKMPNLTGDDDLQLEYAFPAYAQKNRWLNLFKDRTDAIAAIDDGRIIDYIRQSNYLDHDQHIVPAQRLDTVPEAWDSNADGHWSGYVPDCYFAFDDEGFDRDPQGDITGWRAFAYYPFPSTHWPSNGSMSDVIIRLPEVFRQMNGAVDRVAYKINLAVLEALFKQADVPIDTVDETLYGVDLNKDGVLTVADRVVYDWSPLQGRTMSYVGDAKEQLEQGAVHLAANLYPEGTEFINTLRYIDSDDSGQVVMAARMKELRYARKTKWLTYSDLETLALNESKERDDFPDRLRLPMGSIETGLSNGKGWALGGFIEDARGNLRPQTTEELSSCTGCHGGVGITADSTFAFARKLDSTAYRKGWFHWSQKSLKGINEPKIEIKKAGLQYEYCFYLMYNRGADALRSNEEAGAAFLDKQGFLKKDMAARLHDDISLLLHPSAERSLALNKAYYLIVQEQSYTMGREPLLKPAEHTHEQIETAETDTQIEEPAVMTVQAVDPQCERCLEAGSAAVSEALQAAVDGVGMTGPDGLRYDADWSGLIDISNYALDVEGAFFPFPKRHTLPTRMIIPNMATTVCYNCHRLPGPQPPSDPKLTLPVPIPPTAENEPSLSMTRLTDDTGSDIGGEWSPDGARIAWVSNRSGSYQIWTMNADGSDKIQITREPATHGWPRWSPDSTRLVYWRHDAAAGSHSIVTASANGNDVKTITTSDDYLDKPAWHPNGRDIAYAAVTDGNWDIWVADVESDRINHYRITQEPDMETTPLWSPDGSAICFKVAPSGEYSLTIQRIVSFEGGYASPAFHQWRSTQAIQMYDWSPDGSKIAYTAEILTNASGEDRISYAAVVEDVAFADGRITPGMPVNLSNRNTLGDRGPVFSPDSQRVAFWAWDKSYRATLWVANIDGSHLKQVTTRGFDIYPRWRPDGKALLFESGRSGNMDIWTVYLDDDDGTIQ